MILISLPLSLLVVTLTLVCFFRCKSDVRLTSGLTHVGFYFSSGWSDTYLSASLLLGPQGPPDVLAKSKTVLILASPHSCFSFTSTSSLWLLLNNWQLGVQWFVIM